MFFKKTCIWGDCLNKKEPKSNYCSVHTCLWTGCYERRQNVKVAWCNQHICLKCNHRTKNEDIQLCTSHRCNWDDCVNYTDNGDFCDKHELKKKKQKAELKKLELENKEMEEKQLKRKTKEKARQALLDAL